MNADTKPSSSALDDIAIYLGGAIIVSILAVLAWRWVLATFPGWRLYALGVSTPIILTVAFFAARWVMNWLAPSAPSNVRRYQTKRFAREKVSAAVEKTPPGHLCFGLVHETEQPSKSLSSRSPLYVLENLHAFIAGSTGCGKSSLISAIIAFVLRCGWSVIHVTAKPDRATVETAAAVADACDVPLLDLLQDPDDSLRSGTFNPLHGLKLDAAQAMIEGVFESSDPYFRTMSRVAAQGIARALADPTINAAVNFPNLVEVMFDTKKLRAAARFDKRLTQFLDERGREKFVGIANLFSLFTHSEIGRRMCVADPSMDLLSIWSAAKPQYFLFGLTPDQQGPGAFATHLLFHAIELAARRAQNMPGKRRRILICIDELGTFTPDDQTAQVSQILRTVEALAQTARTANVTLLLATQSWLALPETTRLKIGATCKTMIAFGVPGNDEASALADELGNDESDTETRQVLDNTFGRESDTGSIRKNSRYSVSPDVLRDIANVPGVAAYRVQVEKATGLMCKENKQAVGICSTPIFL